MCVRMRCVRTVTSAFQERELKLAADAVLCEVRKKQADVKRMQDILRSLHKLHKLRKEAASRKGDDLRWIPASNGVVTCARREKIIQQLLPA